MTTLFISDLHLEPTRPAITALFLAFLEQRAWQAQALYILGDLFEAWIGDDDDSELGRTVATSLRALVESGIPVYFLHGNRDFLLGERFADASGIQLLPESVIIKLAGEPVLLLHGDTLCTDDVEYQAFRAQVRDPAWQARTLALTLAQRRALAGQLRECSRQTTQRKAAEITDVNHNEVDRIMRKHGVAHLIHGHTHRPALHDWILDGQPMRRAVLSDWYEQGSVLCCDAAGWRFESLPLPGA
ncbi:MAG: UDP-2,3-diacylglucosamine diphosphatase [Gammaproteobacteria bacterium]|nr:UDP-2,3-diacylglucosamine diphosphatase [Gammaproteobacteria bacterium]MCP5197735.1 UDP-2,3-diacylglucosamine diphosphatase [Gammaproteobacteria bacterium]